MSIIHLVKTTARKVDIIQQLRLEQTGRPIRNLHSVMHHVGEECGELSKEVNIATGMLAKEPGSDGVVGEAIDVIVSAIDMIHVHSPNLTVQEIEDIIEKKTNKWYELEKSQIKEVDKSQLRLTTKNHPNCPDCGSTNIVTRYETCLCHCTNNDGTKETCWSKPVCEDCGRGGYANSDGTSWN